MRAFPSYSQTAITGAVDATSSAGAPERNNELASIWRTIVRRRWTVLKIFLGFVALVVIGTLIWPKEYTTTIKVIAGDSNGPGSAQPAGTDLPVLNAFLIASGMQSSETYAELFQETPVPQGVIDQLHLAMSPAQLMAHVDVSPVTNTNILSVNVTWSNPTTSAAIANAFGQAIVDRQRDLVSSQANAALASLKQQLPQAQTRMNDAQDRLAQFEATNHIANIDEQTQATVTNMAALEARIGQVQADQSQAAAQLASTTSQMGSLAPTINGSTTVTQNPVVAQLQTQLTQVNVQLQQDEQQYTNQYPGLIALKQQKTQLQNAIARQQQTVVSGKNQIPNPVYQQLQQSAATYRAQVAADTAQVAELKRQQAAMQPNLSALPAQTAQLADLQLNAKAASDVYSALQGKYVNAQVASQTALSDVTVTQPASAALAKVRPSLFLNVLIAIVLGAVLAVTGALVLDYFDNSIRNEGALEEDLALPQLGSIPNVALRNGEAVIPWVKALALESFLQLVTNVKYSTDQPLKSLAVLSPSLGDGKSTIAMNIALAFNEIGPPVLLVDADLRRPSLHTKLGLSNERGLSDILVGQCSIDEAIQVWDKSGLAVITSGTAAPNPIKLLESPRFDALVKELETRYRTVVFDAAAIVSNIESAVLARRMTGSILVVSHGSTDRREVNSAMRRLSRMGVRNMLGFVINRIDPRRVDYAPYGGEIPQLYGGEDAPIVAPTR
ncbi:MAG TPA: polysaccharide biosynthesis tyrosine autokinase [Verrucomicrobiae bacterium]|nr:polysaccharide biosynthesis tyrosine autokinase [Verrucomicrobiae bacterium]